MFFLIYWDEYRKFSLVVNSDKIQNETNKKKWREKIYFLR